MINRNSSVAVTSTSQRVLLANHKRKVIYISALSAGVTITIAKGEIAAVPNEGIILSQGQTWFEGDGSGFQCWKGEIQVVASGNGTIAISEMIEV